MHDRPAQVKATHLARRAKIYLRQSSGEQVRVNTGSTQFQRNQVRFAQDWGWPADLIDVIDSDLGLSGSAAEHRRGYIEMLAELERSEIGAIFCADVTRVGREAAEFFRLINLCKLHDCLFVVNGAVNDFNDNSSFLLTRVLATIGEHENLVRREHMRRGRDTKAAAGHAVSMPPNGYETAPGGKWVKSADPNVRAAISAVFREFSKARSLKGTVLALKALGIKLPRRDKICGVRWAEPQIGTIASLLKNPAFKGEYHFRRLVSDPRLGRNRRGRVKVRRAVDGEVIVVADHHEAYVTPAEWDTIQSILKLNGPSEIRRNLGPGSALLQGMIRCRPHRNRAMATVYKAERLAGKRTHSYYCQGDYWKGGEQCGRVLGDAIDKVVVDAIIARLAPPRLELIRRAFDEARQGELSEQNRLELELHRVRLQAADLEHRYLAVDANNRLVARALEEKLEAARKHEKHLQKLVARQPGSGASFDSAAFDELASLCADLPTLWKAGTTTNTDRKQIIRTVVRQIQVEERTLQHVVARIVWADGHAETTVEVKLNGYAKMLVEQLHAEGMQAAQIAERLNELGVPTARGTTWTKNVVAQKLKRSMNRKGDPRAMITNDPPLVLREHLDRLI